MDERPWSWFLFGTIMKEEVETKVTYLILSLSLLQGKKPPDKNPPNRRRKRKKEESRRASSSSFLLSRSVWPAFVRHSGVIYHARDAWSSPCQRNPTQPRRRRSPRERMHVCVSVRVQGLADDGMHNTAQVWGKPVITLIGEIAHDPFWFQLLLHLLFSSSFLPLALTESTRM